MTREGTAQSPSPGEIGSPDQALHRAPRSRAPTQSASRTLPHPHQAPALPHSPGPRTATGAQAAGRARRGARSQGNFQSPRGRARAGPLTGLRGLAGTPGVGRVLLSSPLRCSPSPRSSGWRERSRVAGEPEPAAGQPRCAPTRLPEAAGLREAVTPAGRAGQSGARPSRRDGTTGARASGPAWVTDTTKAPGRGAGS